MTTTTTTQAPIGNGFQWYTYYESNFNEPIDKSAKIIQLGDDPNYIWVDFNTHNGVDVSNWLNQFEAGDFMTITDSNDPNTYLVLKIIDC